jgi:CPA2 family monovalent cation:H+ antiporter-2
MGIGLAHIGEFAFVLVLLGWQTGIISQLQYTQLVTLAISSLVLTPLLLRTGLRWTQSNVDLNVRPTNSELSPDVGEQALVIGAGPTGRQIASRLEIAGKNVCLLDYSPLNLQPFALQGFRTISGDATQRDVLELAGVGEVTMIVVCVSKDETAYRIVRSISTLSDHCFLLVRCRYQSNVTKLRKAGADRVVSEEAQAHDALISILNDLTSTENGTARPNAPARRDRRNRLQDRRGCVASDQAFVGPRRASHRLRRGIRRLSV